MTSPHPDTGSSPPVKPGRSAPFRTVSPVLLAAILVMAGATVGMGVAGAVPQVGSGRFHGWWFLLAVGLIVAAVLMGAAMVRAYRMDKRLGSTPAPSPETQVLVRVRPIVRGTFGFGMLMAATGIVAAGWMVLDPEAFVDDAPPQGPVTLTIPADQMPADPSAMTSAQFRELVDRLVQEQTVHVRPDQIGQILILAGFLLLLGSAGVLTSLWLLTNRDRDYLWLSAEGIGYLPTRPGDDGYLAWNRVRAIGHRAQTSRGFVTQHVWTIEAAGRPDVTLQLLPGIVPKADDVFEVLEQVAPHVRRS